MRGTNSKTDHTDSRFYSWFRRVQRLNVRIFSAEAIFDVHATSYARTLQSHSFYFLSDGSAPMRFFSFRL